MPNHVTNILTFEGSGDQISALMERIKCEELGVGSIDFNKIIPMPESLDIEAGSHTDNALYVCMMALNPHGPDLGVPKLSSEEYQKLAAIVKHSKGEKFLSFNENRLSQILKYQARSDTLSAGQAVISNFLQYGYGDWYGWCIHNWGTKWNAYEMCPDAGENCVRFLTAWNPPIPIMDKLSKMFPGVKVDLQWSDEDIGFNVGHIALQGGELIVEDVPEGGSREAFEMAFEVHGANPEDFHLVFDEKEDTYVYNETLPSHDTGRTSPPKAKGDQPKEPER